MTTDPDAPPTFVTRTVTCHTDGCGNGGIALELDVPEGCDAFTCGVCGQPITDVT